MRDRRNLVLCDQYGSSFKESHATGSSTKIAGTWRPIEIAPTVCWYPRSLWSRHKAGQGAGAAKEKQGASLSRRSARISVRREVVAQAERNLVGV